MTSPVFSHVICIGIMTNERARLSGSDQPVETLVGVAFICMSGGYTHLQRPPHFHNGTLCICTRPTILFKYCSTSSLRAAIGWRKASEFHLSSSAEPKCRPIIDPLLPTLLHLPAHSRRNMGLWYSNGLHHLRRCTPSCYTINNACTCRLCGDRQPTKFHLLSCRTSTLARHIVITPVNVNKVVKVLYVI